MKEKRRCSILFHLLVPGGRWQTVMVEIEFVSELLQFHLPQAQPRSIAAAAIGRDGEMLGIGIAGRAHQLPPAADRIDCEAGGVVVDADADPAGVLADVVDPVRHGAALAADEEVVDPHFLRLALRTPFAAGVLEVADQFLLLGIDRDRRLAGGKRCLHLIVDVAEITSAFRDNYRQSLASGLKAATDRSYHGGSFRGGYGHGLAADLVSVNGDNDAQRWAASEKLWNWIDAHAGVWNRATVP